MIQYAFYYITSMTTQISYWWGSRLFPIRNLILFIQFKSSNVKYWMAMKNMRKLKPLCVSSYFSCNQIRTKPLRAQFMRFLISCFRGYHELSKYHHLLSNLELSWNSTSLIIQSLTSLCRNYRILSDLDSIISFFSPIPR